MLGQWASPATIEVPRKKRRDVKPSAVGGPKIDGVAGHAAEPLGTLADHLGRATNRNPNKTDGKPPFDASLQI
jgi:hypothetical protein